MPTKNKEDWINVRVDPDMKLRIQTIVDESGGRYDRVADWIREAIAEKLDPKRRREITEEQFAQMLVRTLQNNPSILAEQLKDIGLQFVLRE